jgi:hypothetical protein
MADEKTGYKHNASDKALDRSAEAASATAETEMHSAGPEYDPAEIRKHDDAGKDRLFEGRQQHDEAEKNSEKTRLAKDVAHHHHHTDEDVADSGTGASAKRKS